ncbi:hypothetical protein MPH_13382, partial [Macrophomina phaseolina MS6]
INRTPSTIIYNEIRLVRLLLLLLKKKKNPALYLF